MTPERIAAALKKATETLLAELNSQGYWAGELSSSALSTATAVVALSRVGAAEQRLIAQGLRWLAEHANADGGWGDTVRSKSNISTTALCWAAFGAAAADVEYTGVVQRAEVWLVQYCQPGAAGPLTVSRLVRAIEERYGKDKTFSVPILVMCQLAGRLGADGWRYITPLPFELAALPHQVFGALQLPVVSYALPALIALGQVIHRFRRSRNPVSWLIRRVARGRTLRKLAAIQPENGGFLEATPLTSFVTMSLAAMGLREHVVVRRGVGFLTRSARADGSWPIDTNLATWLTTLSIKALAEQQPLPLKPEQRSDLRAWLLGQQYRVEHPYTHAAPGGWAWTDLPGGVPDADDTPGALLALLQLGPLDSATRAAGEGGVQWLMDLQNNDGGIPTFCRGWGALPFDRSSPDLTAHTLRAWSAWTPHLEEPLRGRLTSAIARALRFLAQAQRPNGSWVPLWFGNEHASDDENPTYGTALVLVALRELRHRACELPAGMEARARKWLVSNQNPDGGWGGAEGTPSSIEETALALEALARTEHVTAVERGTQWLVERVEAGTWRDPAPIGFYFAKLWYYDRLYPLIFTVGALGRVAGVA